MNNDEPIYPESKEESFFIFGEGHVWIADDSNEWKYLGKVKQGEVQLSKITAAFKRNYSRGIRLDQRRHARMRHVALRAAFGTRARRTRGPRGRSN